MSESNRQTSEVLLHKHTRREFRERMQSGELKACIIPVAATEQHLEHLAMEHDWRSVMLVATEVAKELSPQVIVAPSMNIGISEHHMRHPGTPVCPARKLAQCFIRYHSQYASSRLYQYSCSERTWWEYRSLPGNVGTVPTTSRN